MSTELKLIQELQKDCGRLNAQNEDMAQLILELARTASRLSANQTLLTKTVTDLVKKRD